MPTGRGSTSAQADGFHGQQHAEREPDGGHPELDPAAERVDRGRAALGAVRVEHASHAPGCRKPAGAAGPETAAAAGEGDRHLPRQRGTIRAVLR